MKTRTFFCGWNHYTPYADSSMTSERAYKLMRAWRRNSRVPSNHQFWIFERVGKHEFKVANPAYPAEFHVIKWDA